MQPYPMPPPYMAPPRADSRVVTGGALVFVGFLLAGLGWLTYLFGYGSYYGGTMLFFPVLNGIGYILAAVGFLVAFLGLAQRR